MTMIKCHGQISGLVPLVFVLCRLWCLFSLVSLLFGLPLLWRLFSLVSFLFSVPSACRHFSLLRLRFHSRSFPSLYTLYEKKGPALQMASCQQAISAVKVAAANLSTCHAGPCQGRPPRPYRFTSPSSISTCLWQSPQGLIKPPTKSSAPTSYSWCWRLANCFPYINVVDCSACLKSPCRLAGRGRLAAGCRVPSRVR